MAVEAQPVVERRAPVPSTREQALGAAVPVIAPPPRASSRPATSRLRQLATDLDPRRVSGGESARPVITLGVQNLLKGFAAAVLSVAYTLIIFDLGVSDGTFTALSVASGVTSVLFGLAVAYLADRLPRLAIIGVGCLLFGLSTFALVLAPAVLTFVVAQLGQNLFGSTTDSSPELSLIADYYPHEVRGRVFALNASIGTVGSVLFVLAAGGLIQAFGWRPVLGVGAIAGGLGALLMATLREPERGRWDRLSLGAAASTTRVTAPGFRESVRIAQSVRTLRRICLGEAFLSATGVVLLPIILLTVARSVGLNAAAIAAITALSRLCTLAGIQAGGLLSDRILRHRPGRIMPLIGWVYVANLAALVLIAYLHSAYVLVPLTAVQAFTGALPVTGRDVLLSQVTPARIRTFGVQLPRLYGMVGMLVTLPFALALFGGGTGHVLVVAVVIGSVGALVYLTAAVDVERDVDTARLAALAERRAAERPDGTEQLLVCRGVDVHYDGVQVLFGIDLDVGRGEIVALLGTNGAGKSTLLRAVSGLVEPTGGAIFYAGRDSTHAPAHELARAGIVTMPGGHGVFPGLTVAENLTVAGWSLPGRSEAARRIDDVYAFFPRLRERRGIRAGNLSGGEQQMLALGQAMVMRPTLLLIDELSLGLAPTVVAELLGAVRRLHDQGTTVVVVEQSVDLALSFATRAVFMEKGEVRFDGPASELRNRPELLRSVYLTGTRRTAAPAARSGRAPAAVPVLELVDLSVRYGGVAALTGATLHVNRGEIVGLIGPNGAGKTTLFDAACGFVPVTSGRVTVAGRDVSLLGPQERADAGLARSFQDARLFTALSVVENVQVALQRQAGVETSAAMSAVWLPPARLGEARLRQRAESLLDTFGLGPFRDKTPGELSTGTRRILDLACMSACQPDVLLLDEPSSGIAQAEAEELGPLLERLRADLGCGLLVIEHDMSLLTSVADRLVGMILGRTVVEGSVDEVTSDSRLVAAYLGSDPAVLQRTDTSRQRRPSPSSATPRRSR